MNLVEFLNWVIGAGGSIIIASWIFERLPWFQGLTSKARELIFFGLSTLFSVGAFLVLNYVPVEIIEAVSPYFAMIAGIFATIFIGNGFHQVDKL